MIVPRWQKVMRKVFFKGGGSSGDSYDAAYNRRMATIAEAQQGMADEYFQFWQDSYQPMEQAQIEANVSLIPEETLLRKSQLQHERYLHPEMTALREDQIRNERGLLPNETALRMSQIRSDQTLIPQETGLRSSQIQHEQRLLPQETAWREAQLQSMIGLQPHETDLRMSQIQSEQDLIPQETELRGGQIQSALSLLPQQTALSSAQIGDSLANIRERAPVRAEFYNQALTGLDPQRMANMAAADASQAFMNADAGSRRSAARAGVGPDSGRFAAMSNVNAIEKAKAVGSARSQARFGAEQNNFNRLSTAMGYGG